MTNAPERIWADPDHWIEGPVLSDLASQGYTEYIRADVSDALIAAAYEAAGRELDGCNLGLDPADMADDIRALTPDDARAALDAMLAEARKPKVKPLVWEYHPSGVMAADNLGLSYIIDTRQSAPVFVKWPQGYAPEVKTLNAAKAAAQADYERRILEALE